MALMIGAAHGLDTTSYTVPYVSSWASSVPGADPVEVVQATAERVRTTSLRVLDQLDTAQVATATLPDSSGKRRSARHPPGRLRLAA